MCVGGLSEGPILGAWRGNEVGEFGGNQVAGCDGDSEVRRGRMKGWCNLVTCDFEDDRRLRWSRLLI